jgi:hypothetical protein
MAYSTSRNSLLSVCSVILKAERLCSTRHCPEINQIHSGHCSSRKKLCNFIHDFHPNRIAQLGFPDSNRVVWMHQSYVSSAIILAPSQTVCHFFWLFRPVPWTAPESVGNIAAFPEPTGPWNEKKQKEIQSSLSVHSVLGATLVCTVCSWQNEHTTEKKVKNSAQCASSEQCALCAHARYCF